MVSHTDNTQFPPLPDFLPSEHGGCNDHGSDADLPLKPIGPIINPGPILQVHSLRCGSWLLSMRPTGPSGLVAYDGTLRVECHSGGRTASGDLYQRNVLVIANPGPLVPLPVPLPGLPGPIRPRPPFAVLAPAPSAAAGIPILPRGRYRHYIRVTSLPESLFIGNNFNLGFELWRFTAPNSWALEGARTAVMTRMPAPSGYPSPSDYAEGDVKNAAGSVIARLTMGWLSTFYRRASIEIDTVAGSERPTTSGAGHNWATVMNDLGWQVNVVLSDTNVVEPSGPGWSNAEMHAGMLARRDAVNLDAEWRYHILAVKTIDVTPRGIMYDSGGTDSNNVPREGIGIASHWIIDQGWGLVSGLRFGTAPAPYFRTAVHEIGHAMGLFHTTGDFGFMNTSDVIAAAAWRASCAGVTIPVVWPRTVATIEPHSQCTSTPTWCTPATVNSAPSAPRIKVTDSAIDSPVSSITRRSSSTQRTTVAKLRRVPLGSITSPCTASPNRLRSFGTATGWLPWLTRR